MKMTIKKLKPKLKFITKGNCRPILQHLHVNDGRLYCTDLETSVRFNDSFNMNEGFQPYGTLGLIDSVESKEKEKEFPLLQFDDVSDVQLKTNIAMIEDLLKYVSEDETRLHLNCVVLDCQTADNNLIAVDGHRMKFYEVQPTCKVCEDVTVDADNNNTYLMPRTGLKILVDLLKLYKIKDFTIKLNPETSWIETEFFTLKMRLIQRDFVKWREIVPSKFMHSFKVTKWINLKELKPLFNGRTMGCKIEGKEGLLWLSPGGEYRANRYVIGESDHDFEIGFNVKYIDVASNGLKKFEIKYNNAYKPCLVNGSIVMPLKL